MPLSFGADGVKFDEAAVGKGGAGFLWELHLDERQLTRTSLARPPPWSAQDEDSSDEASVTTIEDISSEANEPTEGAAEVIPSLPVLCHMTHLINLALAGTDPILLSHLLAPSPSSWQ